jgi:hypothetical protein
LQVESGGKMADGVRQSGGEIDKGPDESLWDRFYFGVFPAACRCMIRGIGIEYERQRSSH